MVEKIVQRIVKKQETRKKISESLTGIIRPKHTEERKKYLSKIMTGREFSEETLAKMRIVFQQRVLSEEARGTSNLTKGSISFESSCKRSLPKFVHYMKHDKYPGYKVQFTGCSARVFRKKKDGSLEDALKLALDYYEVVKSKIK